MNSWAYQMNLLYDPIKRTLKTLKLNESKGENGFNGIYLLSYKSFDVWSFIIRCITSVNVATDDDDGKISFA